MGFTPNRGQSGNGTPGSYAVGAIAVAENPDRTEFGLPSSRGCVAFQYADDPPLAPGVSEANRERYTHRDCQQLAIALHEATGWPYAAVCDGYSEELDTYGWMHMGVVTPDGFFLDVEGAHIVDDILSQYCELSEHEDGDAWLIESVRPEQFAGMPDAKMTADDFAEANRVGAAVLAQYRAG